MYTYTYMYFHMGRNSTVAQTIIQQCYCGSWPRPRGRERGTYLYPICLITRLAAFRYSNLYPIFIRYSIFIRFGAFGTPSLSDLSNYPIGRLAASCEHKTSPQVALLKIIHRQNIYVYIYIYTHMCIYIYIYILTHI